MIRRIAHVVAAAIVVANGAFAAEPITEASLLAYASAPYDKSATVKMNHVLGDLNGTPVLVDFVCSDVCPDNTVRVIHLGNFSGAACTAVGGVERAVLVPVAIAVLSRTYCIPKILVDHWNSYLR